jgi:hypothetical protein
MDLQLKKATNYIYENQNKESLKHTQTKKKDACHLLRDKSQTADSATE